MGKADDAADANAVTSERTDTTVPSQSLFMMNSSFVREQSRHVARRLMEGAIPNDEARVNYVTVCCLGRPSSRSEVESGIEFVNRFSSELAQSGTVHEEARLSAWQSYCQVLFCSNEFLYIE